MIAELLSQVESPEFSARVTVASGFKQFLKAIEATPEVKALRAAVEASVADLSLADAVAVLTRLYKLVNATQDRDLANPWDVAIAVYFQVLAKQYPSFARMAARWISRTSGLWWWHAEL